ncbi:MAG: Dna2/Cas4 domain-containing protein [Sarcina sp.]
MENTLLNIKKILNMEKPPKVENYSYCKKCAYYEFCYIKEKE